VINVAVFKSMVVNMKTMHIKNSKENYLIGKIVCVGRNYAKHANELGNELPEMPLLFIKPASAIVYSGGEVIHPTFSNELHHEVELVLLIGEDIKNASVEDAERAIYGYSVGLDMTLRDVQNELKKKGHPWTLAKCFDTSAVISDFALKKDYKLSLDEKIELEVNGEVRQTDTLSSMVLKPAGLVKYISSVMRLDKGDLIFTGTPSGVGKVNRGDKLKAKIGDFAELSCIIS
jgi:5-carboxymethyl-2-hydroxymuconate isomerase